MPTRQANFLRACPMPPAVRVLLYLYRYLRESAYHGTVRGEHVVCHDCIAQPDNDQGITEFEYYGRTVEEKAKEAPVRAERDPMGHRGALHDPYAAAAGAGEE